MKSAIERSAESAAEVIALPSARAGVDLMIVGFSSRKRAAFDLLRKNPATANTAGSLGFTPMFVACYTLWAPGVQALLDAGANTCWPSWGTCKATSAALLGMQDRVGIRGSGSEGQVIDECAEVLHLLHGAGAQLPRVLDLPVTRALAVRDAALKQGYVQVAGQLTSLIKA